MGKSLEGKADRFVLLNREGKVVSVDWQGLSELRGMGGYSGSERFDAVMDNVLDSLLEKGFLTKSSMKGCFYPAGRGVMGANVGPAYSIAGIRYGFAEEKDARKYLPYAEKFDGESVGPVDLVQVV